MTDPARLRADIRARVHLDHLSLVGWAGSRARLLDMMEAAQFPLPPGLPDVVTVWRGACNVTLAQAASGLHWSLDRRAACNAALYRRDDGFGQPIVIRATVPRSAIVFYSDELWEQEIVFRGSPMAPALDGDLADWESAAEAMVSDRWRDVMAGLDAGTLTPLQRRHVRQQIDRHSGRVPILLDLALALVRCRLDAADLDAAARPAPYGPSRTQEY